MRIDDLNRTPLTQGAEKTEQAAEKSARWKRQGVAAAPIRLTFLSWRKRSPRAIRPDWSSFGCRCNPASTKCRPKRWRRPLLTLTSRSRR